MFSFSILILFFFFCNSILIKGVHGTLGHQLPQSCLLQLPPHCSRERRQLADPHHCPRGAQQPMQLRPSPIPQHVGRREPRRLPPGQRRGVDPTLPLPHRPASSRCHIIPRLLRHNACFHWQDRIHDCASGGGVCTRHLPAGATVHALQRPVARGPHLQLWKVNPESQPISLSTSCAISLFFMQIHGNMHCHRSRSAPRWANPS